MDQASGGDHESHPSIVRGTRDAWMGGMTTRQARPKARAHRLRRAIAAVRRRIAEERELLLSPRMELAAARQLARSQRQLEVLSRQLR
jgi:hypothetical protein